MRSIKCTPISISSNNPRGFDIHLVSVDNIYKDQWAYDTQEKILFQAIADFQTNPTGTYRKVVASSDTTLKKIFPISEEDIEKLQKELGKEIEVELNVESPCTCDTVEKLFKCSFSCSGSDGDIECNKRWPGGDFWKKELIIKF